MRPADPRRLLLKPAGTERPLDRAKLFSFFRGILMSRVESYIARMMRTGKISIFEIDERMEQLSEELWEELRGRKPVPECPRGFGRVRGCLWRGKCGREALFSVRRRRRAALLKGADGAGERLSARCSRGIVGETPLRRDGSSAGSGAVCGRSLRAGRKTRRL